MLISARAMKEGLAILKPHLLLDIYDYCHASVRYLTKPLCWRYKNVQVTEQWEDEKRLRRTWETPVRT